MSHRFSGREKTLLSLLIVTLLVSLGLRQLVLNLLPEIRKNSSAVSAKRTELEALAKRRAKLGQLSQQQRLLQEQLAMQEKYFSTNLSGGNTLLELAEKAEGIAFLKVVPRQIIEFPEYVQLPLDLTIRGNYHDILTYLHTLENLPAIAEIASPHFSVDTAQKEVILDFTLQLYSSKEATNAQQWNSQAGRKDDPFAPLVTQSSPEYSLPGDEAAILSKEAGEDVTISAGPDPEQQANIIYYFPVQ